MGNLNAINPIYDKNIKYTKYFLNDII